LIRCSIDCIVDVTGIGSGGCELRFQSLDNTSTRGIFTFFARGGVCKSIAANAGAGAGSGMCLCRRWCWDIYDNVQCFAKVILRKATCQGNGHGGVVTLQKESCPIHYSHSEATGLLLRHSSMPNHSLNTLRYTRCKRTS
jgi:hypothetical protein